MKFDFYGYGHYKKSPWGFWIKWIVKETNKQFLIYQMCVSAMNYGIYLSWLLLILLSLLFSNGLEKKA